MSRLYVGGLSLERNDDDLRKVFEGSGTVGSARVATDKRSGRSKGFGFVEMSTEEEAETAIQNLNGTTAAGGTIRVEAAKLPRTPEKPPVS